MTLTIFPTALPDFYEGGAVITPSAAALEMGVVGAYAPTYLHEAIGDIITAYGMTPDTRYMLMVCIANDIDEVTLAQQNVELTGTLDLLIKLRADMQTEQYNLLI